jgi:hypothetical protein
MFLAVKPLEPQFRAHLSGTQQEHLLRNGSESAHGVTVLTEVGALAQIRTGLSK